VAHGMQRVNDLSVSVQEVTPSRHIH